MQAKAYESLDFIIGITDSSPLGLFYNHICTNEAHFVVMYPMMARLNSRKQEAGALDLLTKSGRHLRRDELASPGGRPNRSWVLNGTARSGRRCVV